MKPVFSVLNDTGPRAVNENTYYCNPDSSIFVIADGMGGRGFGDEASARVIKSVIEFLEHASGDSEATMIVKRKPGISTEQVYLVNSINFANTELIKTSKAGSRFPKMGCSIASLIARSRYISLACVGDIRVYMFRNGKIKKISMEQTLCTAMLIENPRPEQDIPISFLGVSDDISAGIFGRDERVKEQDIAIMMTSSIPKYLTEKEISLIMEEYAGNLDKLNKELVGKSRLKGNRDNTTVISISIN
jgi:PPM family protein phosphatase